MRGDMCPYDHGMDPLVVEDVNLPLPFTPHQGIKKPSYITFYNDLNYIFLQK